MFLSSSVRLIQQTGSSPALWSTPITPAYKHTLTLICHLSPWHHCFWPTQCLTSVLFIWQQPDGSHLCDSFWFQFESNIKACSFAFDTLDEFWQCRKFVFWSECHLCALSPVWAVFILRCWERRRLPWKRRIEFPCGRLTVLYFVME